MFHKIVCLVHALRIPGDVRSFFGKISYDEAAEALCILAEFHTIPFPPPALQRFAEACGSITRALFSPRSGRDPTRPRPTAHGSYGPLWEPGPQPAFCMWTWIRLVGIRAVSDGCSLVHCVHLHKLDVRASIHVRFLYFRIVMTACGVYTLRNGMEKLIGTIASLSSASPLVLVCLQAIFAVRSY